MRFGRRRRATLRFVLHAILHAVCADCRIRARIGTGRRVRSAWNCVVPATRARVGDA
jgi:hypothetical protein